MTSICAVALVRGLSLTLLESSRVEDRVVAGTSSIPMPLEHGRPHSDPFSMHLLGTWRQRTGSPKKEVCFMQRRCQS